MICSPSVAVSGTSKFSLEWLDGMRIINIKQTASKA
jgi:hypothetical protein